MRIWEPGVEGKNWHLDCKGDHKSPEGNRFHGRDWQAEQAAIQAGPATL